MVARSKRAHTAFQDGSYNGQAEILVLISDLSNEVLFKGSLLYDIIRDLPILRELSAHRLRKVGPRVVHFSVALLAIPQAKHRVNQCRVANGSRDVGHTNMLHATSAHFQ
jgi:hypothetical protein